MAFFSDHSKSTVEIFGPTVFLPHRCRTTAERSTVEQVESSNSISRPQGPYCRSPEAAYLRSKNSAAH